MRPQRDDRYCYCSRRIGERKRVGALKYKSGDPVKRSITFYPVGPLTQNLPPRCTGMRQNHKFLAPFEIL
jgi:hypothetical protein